VRAGKVRYTGVCNYPAWQIMKGLALAWLLHQEGVTSVIVGAKRAEQLEDNLRAIEVELTAYQLEHLYQVSALPAEYPGWMLDWPWDTRMKRGPDS
jgi:aryl-alcohol dehydrogenase-like predicted oxidoreductase